ncbi:MAG: xanthine dehydrogenase family protein subunit M [Negativicutes bacterium]|nr:xanthine dehydrogenase family protein subunit M [Negativicutes bacterium]
MHKFEYHEPKAIADVISLLETYGDEAKILAGGTDLIVRFRKGSLEPQHIIDIKKIPGTDSVRFSEQGLEIGPAATMYDTEKYCSQFPEYQVLAQAIHSVASCQIRNRATVIGNVCNASPAADTLPALVVLDAQVRIAGSGGNRVVLLENFFAGPGKTVLAPGELVTGLLIPPFTAAARGVYLKHSRRRMVDLATVGLAAFSDSRTVRIALGAVAPTVIRAKAAELLLAEEGLTHETAAKAARMVPLSAAPITDIRASREYRLEMVAVLAERALQSLIRGEQPC